jgi:gluconate kinase
MIDRAGARCVLVYLNADREILWRRICERRQKEVDANCALEIDEGLLDSYLKGFEEPVGEEEIVVHVK